MMVFQNPPTKYCDIFESDSIGENMTSLISQWKLRLLVITFFAIQGLSFQALAALARPSSLTAVPISGSTDVQLKWKDRSNNEEGFVVQRSFNSSSSFADVGRLAANTVSFRNSGLQANTIYYYRVGAFYKNRRGYLVYSYSSVVSVKSGTQAPPATTITTTMPPTNPPPTVGAVTDLKIQSLSAAVQSSVPFTFGQVFAPGHLLASESLAGKMTDGSVIPLQVNIKALHPDGSVRHAILSAVLPQLAAGQMPTMNLVKVTPTTSYPGTPAELLSAGFTSSIRVTLGGVDYSASADALLKEGKGKSWLAGPIANEWLLMAPLKNSQGADHPHLTARFSVRTYVGLKKAKVDVTLENNWAFELAPQNFTYDVQILVGGQSVYTKAALNHFHHSRWRKVFWWGGEPQVHLKHNVPYLISTKAVPNYDQSIPVAESALNSLNTRFTGATTEPMATGLAMPAMPTTGGRPDIGLNPAWVTMYVLSQDVRAKKSTLGTADLAGSWSSHFRDRTTDRPLSIVNYPYSTLLGNPGDTVNPATGKSEAFPACGGVCTNPNIADSSHQPNLAFVPYLVTGDFYYLEELQFWAMYNVFQHNPYYRDFQKGLIKSDQVRGQGWSLRTLADAAYISPEGDPLKAQLMGFVNDNLDWFNANYTNLASANVLGVITNGYSLVYNSGRGLAPWMDDFFTQAVGRMAELGFVKAKPLLAWKAKFQISRMVDPGFCWISGGIYALNVRDSSTLPLYTTMKQAYVASEAAAVSSLSCAGAEMATALGLKVGEMTGYSSANTGYPSNYQPALAYAVDSGAVNGLKAWQIFMGRSVKPDYQNGPQFSIVPR